MSKIHLLTYATWSNMEGWDHRITQDYLVNSIESKTKKEVIFHTYNLSSIKHKSWFKYIQDFPNIPLSKENKWWNRSGYWCTWKAFLCQEVFEIMGENDLLYYIDSSQYFRNGFNENLDKLFDYVLQNESIFGSAGNDWNHYKHNSLNNIDVWKKIWPESIRLMPKLLTTQHLLVSYLILKKDSITKYILDQWVNIIKNVKLNGKPIFSFHHTPEQGILNILIYQHNLKVFFSNLSHANTKNPNLIHYFMNNSNLTPSQFIINPNLINIL